MGADKHPGMCGVLSHVHTKADSFWFHLLHVRTNGIIILMTMNASTITQSASLANQSIFLQLNIAEWMWVTEAL